MPGSTPETPINCDVDFDSSNVAGKTAVVTGGKLLPTGAVYEDFARWSNLLRPGSDLTTGANGLGEAYVRALHAAK